MFFSHRAGKKGSIFGWVKYREGANVSIEKFTFSFTIDANLKDCCQPCKMLNLKEIVSNLMSNA